ncbi:hypothetical protein ACFYY9_26310 [Streptomyces nigra]|uniref:hypothetical protein n=1 Tax=Streptomyces nigra TaxID=1827580 RepID=UPI0036A70DC3
MNQPPTDQQLHQIKAAVAASFDQHEPAESRQARWEDAAWAAGREVDRNALAVYMAVADAEQQALADNWAASAAAQDAEIRRLKAPVHGEGEPSSPLTDTRLDEIETRAAYLDEYATLTDEPLQTTADLLTGTDVPALLAEVRRFRAQLAAVVEVHEKGEHNGLPICLHCASQMFPPPETGVWSESAYPCATLRALGITEDEPAAAAAVPAVPTTTKDGAQ